ncbi:alpha/beta fold hydrolase [Galbibacter sp.]|uniref:alpha/beta fold hydrolase n=1 Tax=Galbibacter sp. TaxID=2918471 RepID=UPI003A8D58C7
MNTKGSLLLFSFFLGFWVLLTSCQKAHQIDVELFIPVDNSKLYVRLAGNANGPIVINLHGGPGAFSGFARESYKDFLEQDYLIAYLDQRGGGKSAVEKDSTMLTMKQFVKDLDIVVDTLRKRYKGKAINLIGSSWGGTLGLLYMVANQQKINAFACISGKADGMYPILALIAKEKELATEFLNKANDSASKERYQKILSKLNEMENSDFDIFFKDMNLIKHTYTKALGFDAYWANKEAQQTAAELASDTAYFRRAGYTMQAFDRAMEKYEYVNRVFRNTPAYNHLNILDEISVIQKPILVLQGEFDYAIGVQQAKMIYEALTGVSMGDKKLIIIPETAHNLNLEAPKQYNNVVKSFFNKYN